MYLIYCFPLVQLVITVQPDPASLDHDHGEAVGVGDGQGGGGRTEGGDVNGREACKEESIK